jgi:hypothetical protein
MLQDNVTPPKFGLYIWSHRTAGREISKKLQPFVDDLFKTPSERESKGKRPAKPNAK